MKNIIKNQFGNLIQDIHNDTYEKQILTMIHNNMESIKINGHVVTITAQYKTDDETVTYVNISDLYFRGELA